LGIGCGANNLGPFTVKALHWYSLHEHYGGSKESFQNVDILFEHDVAHYTDS